MLNEKVLFTTLKSNFDNVINYTDRKIDASLPCKKKLIKTITVKKSDFTTIDGYSIAILDYSMGLEEDYIYEAKYNNRINTNYQFGYSPMDNNKVAATLVILSNIGEADVFILDKLKFDLINGGDPVYDANSAAIISGNALDLTLYIYSLKTLSNKFLDPDLIVKNSLTVGNRKTDSNIGLYSTATGDHTEASGECSYAGGYNTIASGDRSHAEGYNTKALEHYSHAEGSNTEASGLASHAEGESTIASGDYSHVEGYNTKASSNSSHAEGEYTTASGYRSHAEGFNTKASSNSSHAEGEYTTASGYRSHAEGYHTTASKSNSHAEGEYTTASWDNSHAEGYYTKASGDSSHAEGGYTLASSNYQHVQGKFNIEDTNNTYAHIVGNGSGTNTRSNAHTLDWNGNAWFAGNVYIGGSKQDEGKELVTKDYVNDAIEASNAIKDGITLRDQITGYNYILQIRNGILTTVSVPNEIKIKTNPTKLEYYAGDRFDISGIELELIDANGESSIVNDIENISVVPEYVEEETNSVTIKYNFYGFELYVDVPVIVSAFDPAVVLADFEYTSNSDGTYTITGWKQTLNGVSSTELIIPDNNKIIL